MPIRLISKLLTLLVCGFFSGLAPLCGKNFCYQSVTFAAEVCNVVIVPITGRSGTLRTDRLVLPLFNEVDVKTTAWQKRGTQLWVLFKTKKKSPRGEAADRNAAE